MSYSSFETERPTEEVGLVCPKCGQRRWTVYYVRPKKGGVFRVRECRECGYLLRTLEQPAGD